MKIDNDSFKYIAFLLLFVVLFLPENNSAWIWFVVIAGICLVFWVLYSQEGLDKLKYLGAGFLIVILLLDVDSKAQKILIWFVVISFVVWGVKYLWDKWE